MNNYICKQLLLYAKTMYIMLGNWIEQFSIFTMMIFYKYFYEHVLIYYSNDQHVDILSVSSNCACVARKFSGTNCGAHENYAFILGRVRGVGSVFRWQNILPPPPRNLWFFFTKMTIWVRTYISILYCRRTWAEDFIRCRQNRHKCQGSKDTAWNCWRCWGKRVVKKISRCCNWFYCLHE